MQSFFLYLENCHTYLIYYQGLNFCCFIQKRKVFQSTLNPSRDALFVPMLQNFFGCRINRVIAPKEFYLIKTIFDNILVSNLGCKTSAFLRGKEKSTIAGNDLVNFLVEIKLRMKKSSIFLFRRK